MGAEGYGNCRCTVVSLGRRDRCKSESGSRLSNGNACFRSSLTLGPATSLSSVPSHPLIGKKCRKKKPDS